MKATGQGSIRSPMRDGHDDSGTGVWRGTRALSFSVGLSPVRKLTRAVRGKIH